MRILHSFLYAFEGIVYTYKTQVNFKIHLLGFLFMNVSAYFLQFNLIEYLICFVLSALVFCTELFNTAIEALVDLNTLEPHPLAKIAKDCAAGSVLVIAIASVITWAIIVVAKFL